MSIVIFRQIGLALVLPLIMATAAINLTEGQKQSNNLIIGTIDSIHSAILNEERKIWVSFPDSATATYKRNPVLYVLDAESDFYSATTDVRRLPGWAGSSDISFTLGRF